MKETLFYNICAVQELAMMASERFAEGLSYGEVAALIYKDAPNYTIATDALNLWKQFGGRELIRMTTQTSPRSTHYRIATMRSVLANHNGYIGYMKHQTTAKLKRLIAKLEAAGETGQMYETAVAELERREEVPA